MHATALWETLHLTSLRLILHAPEDLFAGTPEHDLQLDGALSYAALCGAEMIVYHGAQSAFDAGRRARRLADERRSLRRALRRAERLGVRIAIQNLRTGVPRAPRAGGRQPARRPRARLLARLGGAGPVPRHRSRARRRRAGRLRARRAGRAGARSRDRVRRPRQLRGRPGAPRSGGIEPLRLDLHMPPGAGTVPWAALAPTLAAHPAPLQLEIHPNLRPEPAHAGDPGTELLGLRAPALAVA